MDRRTSLQPVLCRLKLDRTSILYELGGKRIHPVGNVDKPSQVSNQYVSDRIYKFYYGKRRLISLQSQYEKLETLGPVGSDHLGIELGNVKIIDEV